MDVIIFGSLPQLHATVVFEGGHNGANEQGDERSTNFLTF